MCEGVHEELTCANIQKPRSFRLWQATIVYVWCWEDNTT